MGKARRGTKEINKEQKLLHENKKLKQAISQLRKQLARIDLDRYDTIREMLDEHKEATSEEINQNVMESLKKTWTCNECRSGFLEIILYNKIDATFYYRKCSECSNRTKSQKYSPEVKGIIKKAATE